MTSFNAITLFKFASMVFGHPTENILIVRTRQTASTVISYTLRPCGEGYGEIRFLFVVYVFFPHKVALWQMRQGLWADAGGLWPTLESIRSTR